MSITVLDFAEPFFPVDYLVDEQRYYVSDKCIVFNLSETPILINGRKLSFFQSTVAVNTEIQECKRVLVIKKFDLYDTEELFDRVRNIWPRAYDVTGAERHKGIKLWRSPKIQIGNVAINMCYAGSVPLNVGLHREHWGGPPIKEVHVQIVGTGRMQQFTENDISTLYREDPIAPGGAHPPMYDDNIEYPWHQYETNTESIFMAVEFTP